MEAYMSARLAQWLEDEADTASATTAPVCHKSSQVSGAPQYVAEICGRFAGEKTEEEQNPA